MLPLIVILLISLLSQAAARNLEEDFSAYSVKFARCFKVKIPDEDEDQEGNSYFYNGAYRSQSKAYAGFHLCSDGCGDCDTSVGYVTDIDSFLDAGVNYVQQYCYACQAQCRRLLEEGGQKEGTQADCRTCSNVCKSYNSGNNGGTDETQYLNCQAAYADENGLQYYAGPGCSDDGHVVIRLYYDADCTIRASDSSDFMSSFAYNIFQAVEKVCTDCDESDVCDEALNSYQCVNGYNKNENIDDSYMKVCKSYKQAMKEWQYATAKGQSPLRDILFFGMTMACVFVMLSYTYYVRHKKAAITKEQLEGLKPARTADGDYVGMT